MLGCNSKKTRPLYGLDLILNSNNFQIIDLSLVKDYIVFISDYSDKKRIQLFDLNKKKIVFLPNLNPVRLDPISVSLSGGARKIAFINTYDNENQVFIHNRKTGVNRRIYLSQKDIPFKVSLSAAGNTLAVEVMRNGIRKINIIKLSN